MKICIAGQNNIAVYFADYILKNYPDIEILACINKNDDGKNKFHRSFLSYCKIKNIPIKNLADLYEEENLFFFSTEFDKIIKTKFFKSKNLYNIHFSLLPKYKGMYTSALPILHGEKYSGVTLHKIDDGIDTGDIIDQIKFKIDSLNCEQLYNLYTQKGLGLLIKCLEKILNQRIKLKKQSKKHSTYFSKASIDYKNIIIDLNKTAYQIDTQLRAFTFPFKQVPEVFGHKIIKSEILEKKTCGKSGTIVEKNDQYIIINTIDYQIKLFLYKIDELIDAAKIGDSQKIKKLIECKYNIYEKNNKGWDALIVATYNGHLDLVKFLVENLNWNVNTHNNNGTSFLMYAMTYSSMHNNLDLLKYVINLEDINLFHKDFMGKNVLDYAIEYNNLEVINFLQSKIK